MLSNRLMSALLACLGVLTTATACDVLRLEAGRLDDNLLSCTTDEDCLDGYRCTHTDGAPSSICTAANNQTVCDTFNQDGDEYLADGAPAECFGLRGDCDDTDPLTYPGAAEICDGRDNNCDGRIDEGLDIMSCPLQLGVCNAATTVCTDGEVEDCATSGAYGPNYEADGAPCDHDGCDFEHACDGLDNDCDGKVDEGCCSDLLPITGEPSQICPGGAGSENCNTGCRCIPGEAYACGRDTGACTRGIRVCQELMVATELPCLQVEEKPYDELVTCATSDDCGAGEYCVSEEVSPNEDYFDNCFSANDPACTRRVCRAPQSNGETCTTTSDCSGTSVCLDGECRIRNVQPLAAELCNGIDDDCDGSIDESTGAGPSAVNVCGSCPYNSVRVNTGLSTNPIRCVDRYEASRLDATDTDAGSSSLYSVSMPGVLPWTDVTPREAYDACAGTEYREIVGPALSLLPARYLCIDAVWTDACGGPAAGNRTTYPYGNTYEAGRCADNSGVAEAVPTGSMEQCNRPASSYNDVSLFDMSGNVAEWTVTSTHAYTTARLRGGSYLDGSAGLTCTATVSPTNPESHSAEHVGFRCCSNVY